MPGIDLRIAFAEIECPCAPGDPGPAPRKGLFAASKSVCAESDSLVIESAIAARVK
jgi:hypothetical protein